MARAIDGGFARAVARGAPRDSLTGRLAARSVGVLAEEAAPDRPDQDLQVEPKRPALDVVEVVLDALLERRIPAQAVDLRPAGHARLDLVAQHVARDLASELVDEERPLGPRSDEAHLTTENVKELRQFVEAPSAQKGADRRAAVVARLRPHGSRGGLRVGSHRPELEHREGPAIEPHP